MPTLSKSKKKPDVILTFCAHNDDQLLGAGGTLANYAKEGKIFKSYIFSFGESSHPLQKGKITATTRVKEAQRAEKILGGREIFFFGLKERQFDSPENKPKVIDMISAIIKREKPIKIFTHSLDDPHPDHRAVYHAVMQTAAHIDYKGDVYSFNIWNPINIRKRNNPRMVVDISNTFQKKVDAFKVHKSQRMTFITLWWDIYRRDRLNGFLNGCSYAEVFIKVR